MIDAHTRPQLPLSLLQRLRDAPRGSAIAKAREFGIDVAALAIRLSTTTPLARLEQLDQWQEAMRRLRDGMD